MDLLTSQEAARVLGVQETTLRQWRRRGQGPRWFKVGVAVMYRIEDITAWQRSEQAS